jgi:sugar O-acyltransferase (sialic acid O-acetyltransferase NeuD family)
MPELYAKMSLSILGSGGHASVIIDAAELSGFNIEYLFDDDINKWDSQLESYKIKGPISDSSSEYSIIAIGDNKTRRNVCLKKSEAKWATIIHPSSIISKNVIIGEGTVIMAGVIIQSGAKIGKHCILNTGACIDHDCILDDFVHISPKCGLAGSVFIGEGTSVGIGSSIIPNVSIGKWSVIGAGSVVITDLPDYCTAIGVPSKAIKFHNE